MVERLLPSPEVRGSIPISDIIIVKYSTNCNLEKTKIKKKKPGEAHLLKNLLSQTMKPAFATDSTAKHKLYFSLSALRLIIFERMVLSFTSIFSTLQRMDWLSVQRVINSRSKCMTNISFRYSNHCILVNCKFS